MSADPPAAAADEPFQKHATDLISQGTGLKRSGDQRFLNLHDRLIGDCHRHSLWARPGTGAPECEDNPPQRRLAPVSAGGQVDYHYCVRVFSHADVIVTNR